MESVWHKENTRGDFGGESFGDHCAMFHCCRWSLKNSTEAHGLGQLCTQVTFCSQIQVQVPTASAHRRTGAISHYSSLQSRAENLGRSQGLRQSNLRFIHVQSLSLGLWGHVTANASNQADSKFIIITFCSPHPNSSYLHHLLYSPCPLLSALSSLFS